MSVRRLRLCLDGADHGERQMARDRAAYGDYRSGDAGLLRFYAWSAPCLSLGRFQRDQALCERAQALKLPLVQRPTGGQAILHGGDLTFSLVGPPDWLPGGLLAGHARFAAALAAGLGQLGLRLEAGDASSVSAPSDCFATSSPADLRLAQGKLIGTAQVRRRQAFLIQGTLYLQADQALIRRVFPERSEPLLSLDQLLHPLPTPAAIAAALADGLIAGLELTPLNRLNS